MKYLPILLLCSCVTSSDLLRVESKVDEIQADGIVTEDERDELQETIAAVAKDVEERTSGTLEDLAATGGITGILTGVGLSLYRNRTRRRDLERMAQGSNASSA